MTDLDRLVERRASGSFKWDGTGRLFGRDDLLPFWVADMDFRTPGPILDAIRQRLEHPVLGYEERPAAYTETVLAWLADRHDWQVPAEWLKFCPPSSIVAIYGLIVTLTNPGDGIVVPTPTYGPLIDLVKNTNRRLLRCPLREGATRFELDIDAMAGLIDADTRMVLLCSPHNPTGRVFTNDELSSPGRAGGPARPAGRVGRGARRPGAARAIVTGLFGTFGHTRAATVISPNKSFNTAGLPQATVISPDADVRSALQGFLVQHNSITTRRSAPSRCWRRTGTVARGWTASSPTSIATTRASQSSSRRKYRHCVSGPPRRPTSRGWIIARWNSANATCSHASRRRAASPFTEARCSARKATASSA
ncbi:MAG: aminotransferase class I/II-fold pyridoxal phosphate-dependent enzyme [Woeseiaceae bacterium]|nr:aminotransferase class I/II-fold pyridoxal phosphate-dependent enzyme [Woeseiaceae bacterium]